MGGGLRVEGLVDRPRLVGFAELGRLPGAVVDLGTVAAGFVGRAVPVGAILAAAPPRTGATHATVISAGGARDGGDYRASVPLEDLGRSGWLAFSLGEAPLPEEHGGPLRLVVAEGRTLCWNVKGVTALEYTAGTAPDSVPENPPH